MTKAISIDLETLSTNNDAAVLAIGAVVFDEDAVHEALYIPLSPDHGHISASTVLWWMGQSDDARKAITEKEPMNPALAAGKLAAFYELSGAQEVWANSPNFDMVILENWWSRVSTMKWPFHFRHYRDLRTLKNLARDLDIVASSPKPVTAHNALDDARSQAEYIIAQKQMFAALKRAAL